MRKSIITDKEECFLCGGLGTDTHHCLFGRHRQKADEYGLTVKLCRACHNRVHNPRNEWDMESQEYLKREAQYAFEDKVGTREEFRKIFDKSYLSWKE